MPKRVIDWIVDNGNFAQAIEAVKTNKGAAGIDKMTVDELDEYFINHGKEIKQQILDKKYKPSPVRRVYIPKANGKQRPLGIPTVVDRTVQQAVAQVLSLGYDKYFSEHSYGFRPKRSAQMAIKEVLRNLNEGYTWVIDLDIAKYFDTVNHDRLISILREKVNDSTTLHLVRKFLQAGVMEDGLFSQTTMGVPQGGPLSPILSNVYLDKFDKELESRGLRFVRYADDCNIFVRSEKAAKRVMKSVISWLDRKLGLKVNTDKTKIVRPNKSKFLGYGFWNSKGEWRCKPADDRKERLYDRTKEILCRRKAVARPMGETFKRLNQLIRGWINYFRIGDMKTFLKKYGQWLRHKVRVVILKQWKRPKTIYKNLKILVKKFFLHFDHEDLFKVANSRLGWYRKASYDVVNYIISPDILALKTKRRPGLVNPYEYYLSKFESTIM